MSKFCIGIIKNKRTPKKDMIRYIYEVINKEGLEVFFQIQDTAPFLDHYAQDSIIFSIADNPMYDTCEMLFLTDNCYYNGKANLIPFVERMHNINSIIQSLMDFGGDFDLFVGETGALDSDFEFIPFNKTIFEKQMELYQHSNSSFFPNIHFSKTEAENQEGVE